MKKLVLLRYGILLVIIGLALWRLWPEIQDFRKVVALKDQLHYGWIGVALFSQIFQYIGDAWLSVLILRIITVSIGLKSALLVASLNVFAAHVLPVGEAGGVALAYHFYKKLGTTTQQFVFLSLCWGAYTNGLLLLMFFLPLFLIPNIAAGLASAQTIMLIAALLIFLLFLGLLFRNQLWQFISSIVARFSWGHHVIDFLRDFGTYRVLLLHHPGTLLLCAVATIIYYGSNVATLFCSFLAFGITPSIPLVTFAFAASLIIGRLALAPAGIGAAEASLIIILTSAGLPSAETLGAVLIYRIMSFWLPIPAGAVSFFWLRKIGGRDSLNLKQLRTQQEQDLIDL